VFRLTPLTQAARDHLRQRFLDKHAHLVPKGPRGRTSSAKPRRPLSRSDERSIGYVPYSKASLPEPLPATLVAFYLPQFHAIPENDEWWGIGFTEWRNVTRALPQFEGHQQPKLPADLGFYDLRNPTVMRDQSRLASEYGISAFCFYFYWFHGKTLLESPLRSWLAERAVDLSFCLCWANEKWTRTWDGRGEEILIDQSHDPEDDLNFIAHIAEFMRDPRYLKVDGKPLLLVYRPGLLPDSESTAERWRTWCRDNGICEIHLAYVQSFEQPDPREIGFDSAVEFPPNLSSPRAITANLDLINDEYSGAAFDWREMAASFQDRRPREYTLYRSVNTGWDNEARRPGSGRTYLFSSPRGYRDWLAHSIATSAAPLGHQPMVFINAWNEWAEGATLEPDLKKGHAMLHATRQALDLSLRPFANTKPVVVIHAWHIEELQEILDSVAEQDFYSRLIITTSPQKEVLVRQQMLKYSVTFEIQTFENRGRDILPFLHVANQLLDQGQDLVLKLHTKRSPHIRNGQQWLHELVQGLTARENVKVIERSFGQNPMLGMVTADGHRQLIRDYMGANNDELVHLTSTLGLPTADIDEATFAAGSMFWVRLSSLRPVLDGTVVPSSFQLETAQIDGTAAHAFERIFGLSVHATGHKFLTLPELKHEGYSAGAREYPFAHRGC